MKTIYAEAQPGKVVLKEKELPALGSGDVLLKAMYSAISPGTENGLLGEHIVPLPTNIGYAMVAEILEKGEDVWDFEVGDYVIATVEHAQYIVCSGMDCTPCPKDLDLKQAAFWNLGHTGMYAFRRSNLQLGEPCAVLGQGFVGAITAQIAKIAGACPVIVTDLDDKRLEAAKKMGVDIAINSKTDPDGLERVVKKIGRGDGLPVIFEATGARGPLMQAANLVGERGRLVMISQVHGEDLPPIDDPLMQKGASLIGTYVNSRPYKIGRADLQITGTWPPVMNTHLSPYHNSDIWTADEDIRAFLSLLEYKKLDISPLISHEFSYKEIPEAYKKHVFPKIDPEMTGGVISWND